MRGGERRVTVVGGRLRGLDFRVYALGQDIGGRLRKLGDAVQRGCERAAMHIGLVEDLLEEDEG